MKQRPGIEILRRLKERRWSRQDLAFVVGKNVAFVSRVIRGDRITATTALLLAAAFQVPASFWMDLDVEYRLENHIPNEAKLAGIRERLAQHERGEKITTHCPTCGQKLTNSKRDGG